jgi:hypothetical protein
MRPTAPASYNRYGYVLGDPVAANDPTGLVMDIGCMNAAIYDITIACSTEFLDGGVIVAAGSIVFVPGVGEVVLIGGAVIAAGVIGYEVGSAIGSAFSKYTAEYKTME